MLTTLAALLAVSLGGVFLVLQPPAPLPAAPQGAVLENVIVVEPGVSHKHYGQLRVEGGRIVHLGEQQSTGDLPVFADGEQLDSEPLYVLRGLSDMHMHAPMLPLPGQRELFALMYLRHGVTNVRNAGNSRGLTEKKWQAELEAADYAGPVMKGCGAIIDGDEPNFPGQTTATTEAEGREVVRQIAGFGYNCIKVYNSLSPAVFAAIIDEAAKHSLPVMGHIPKIIPVAEAKGIDAQHFAGLGKFSESTPPKHPLRLLAMADADRAHRRNTIKAMQQGGLEWTPTLITYNRKFAIADGLSGRSADAMQQMPRVYRDVLWEPDEGITSARIISDEQREQFRQGYKNALRLIAEAHAAGVTIRTGTDVPAEAIVPGAGLQEELHRMQEAGLSAAQVLRLSQNGWQFFGEEEGSVVTVGSRADLIVLKQNPEQSLDALDSLVAVVVDGRLYSKAELDAQMEKYQRWFNGRWYDRASTKITRVVLDRLLKSLAEKQAAEHAD